MERKRVKEGGQTLFKIRHKAKPKTEYSNYFSLITSPKHLKWCVASCIVLATGSKNSTFLYKVFGYLIVTIILLMMAAKYRRISEETIANLEKNQVFFLLAQ